MPSNCCQSFSKLLNVFQVEFPEARIYEDTLNVLLYEHRDKGPDAELLQATRGYTVGGNGYHSDEDVDEKLDLVDKLRRK